MAEPDEEPAPDAIVPDDPVHCLMCNMWLNGPTQMEDHMIGKKHKRNKYLALHEFVIMFAR